MIAQGEGERGRPVVPQVADPLFRLVGARPVPFGDPPAGKVGLGHPLEKFAALPEDGAVEVADDEGGEVLYVSPDRHVDDHAGTVASVPGEGSHRGGVALLGLQSPDEAGGPVGGSVHRVKRFDESRQLRVVQRFPEPTDVDLRQLPAAHVVSLS